MPRNLLRRSALALLVMTCAPAAAMAQAGLLAARPSADARRLTIDEAVRMALELARQSLRNTRARVEAGTIPAIDIVEAEAEVAQREEAVIVAEARIATAEDALRALVYDPAMPDFWTLRIEPASAPTRETRPVDVDAAVRDALAQIAEAHGGTLTLQNRQESRGTRATLRLPM